MIDSSGRVKVTIGRHELLTGCRNVSLLLTCSRWGRFQELELKISIKPLFFSFCFPPKVFTYVDRTVVLAHRVKVFISIGNACVWHWVWQVKLSELQMLPSCILPALHGCSPAWLQFGSLPRAFCGSFPPPSSSTHHSEESFLSGNQEFGLTDYFSQVPSCQPNWSCSSFLCAFSVSPPLPTRPHS